MLPSDGSPLVAGGSSAPATPTAPASVDSLSKLLYGPAIGSKANVPSSGSLSQFLNITGSPSQLSAGHTPPGTILGADGKPTYNVEGVKPLPYTPGGTKAAPVTVPIGTRPMAETSSGGLANPQAISQLAALAKGGGGGGGAPNVNINTQATDLVNAQFQPVLDELNRQLAEDKAVYGQQSDQVKADQARLDSNVQAIYSLLRNQIGELQGKTDQQYAGTEQQVGGSYDQLMGRLNQIYGGAGQQLQGDLNQLGIGGDTADKYGNHSLIDNYNLLTGLANTDRTSTLGNLRTEGQGFHSLLGDQAVQATATGDDRQSAIDTLAAKELTQLHNNLQNQLNVINQQKININTEKGQQIAAEKLKLQTALAQTNNQLALAEAKLAQGAERINISKQSLAQRINQNTFADQLALDKLNKTGAGSSAQNKTKLGNTETTLSGLLGKPGEAGAAFDWLTGGTTVNGQDLLTMLNTKGLGAVPTKALQSESNVIAQKYGDSPDTVLQALKLALLSLGGYGYTG